MSAARDVTVESTIPPREAILERVRSYLDRRSQRIATSEEPAIPEGADLVDAGYLDSMGLMDLVAFLEEEFTIRVENDELRHENLASLDACSRFVRGKLEQEARHG